MIEDSTLGPQTPESVLALEEDGRIDGKIALVTCAGGGVGRVHAMLLASRGASVIVADHSLNDGEQTADDIRSAGGRAIAVAVDITVKSQARMLAKYASGIFGELDILVNSAGSAYILRDIEGQHDGHLETLFTYNVSAPLCAGNKRVCAG
ncbi:SDR family NAD(P)-dependent oxidoreductase [Rouxiella sp. S1S-2]|uniref:SDR family NAD(P)-dependent oxidoreductase n=1 Tax=Rouxiella sp. S1S-2 TaxID=2653856 RepID=UPI0012650D8B|nr:SDR family NAD(P)-dependent oxidoreductase [Rouxiella sp. S1S-2]KAB7897152.1 SDR family NAD(P)-dependent oxidoreductase [Rouxiella sp. S1S-2]